MGSSGKAVHVATTTRRYKNKVYKTHLLRRTYREDGKVKHETLGNLSHLPDAVVELVRRSLKGETLVPAGTAFAVERTLAHGHVAAVLGTLRKLGVDRLVASKRSRQRDLVVALLVARLLRPGSKLATARSFEAERDTLGEVLELGNVDEDELYEAMDWLGTQQAKIERALAKRHLAEGTLVFCDVTSSYFEGRTCPLAQRGHNRDGKRGKLQVVFGLLCEPEGRPVAVRVFEANTGDPSTVAPQLETLRERFGLNRVVLIGDRGLLTSSRIREDVALQQGLGWVSALRAPSIRKLVRGGSLQLSLFDERDLAEIRDPDYPGERLIVCRNPLLADERGRKREELLAATERELDKVVQATRRKRDPIRGKETIGLRVGKVLDRYNVGKHFQLKITDARFSYQRDQDKIDAEAALDGLYILRTSLPAEELPAEQAVAAYKNLSRVERTFRCLKGVDVKVRPIHHHLAKRVRAHIFLCMLAYYVEWHMRRRLAPLLFEDDDPEGAAERRDSIVAPARRSERAERQAGTLRTEEGFPVHSFPDLLAYLGTLSKQRVRARLDTPVSFDQYTETSPLQRRAFELLGVSPRL